MAEFKLGRIRFVWKGDWAQSTTYYKDDIIRNGGNTYVCIAGHTSSGDFPTDLLAYWNKITDGQEWKGAWQNSTYYKVNDVVKYGGYLYIANEAHTSDAATSLDIASISTDGSQITIGFADTGSIKFVEDQQLTITNVIPDSFNGTYTVSTATTTSVTVFSENTDTYVSGGEILLALETDQAKWDLYAEGFDYKAAWTADTHYKVNDIVKYNSTIYICTEAHISGLTDTLGLEPDQDKWDVFSKGLEWRGDWTIETRYVVNDIVRYGGIIYVCNEGHTSADNEPDGLELDQEKWDFFHKGITYLGNWSTGTRYRVNDLVKSGGGIWICTDYHISTINLAADESNWAQFVEGLEFEDSWDSSERYERGDIVTYGGYSYVAVTNNRSSRPTENPQDWDLFTTGFKFIGDWGEDSSAQDYNVGDVVRLGGYTYLCIEDHGGFRPPNTLYWERLNSGIYWKDAWTDATLYDAGDSVRYNDNSYICVLAHTSDETVDQNRPDQDVTGEFWNLLSGGPENNVMNTQGDLVYYGGAGPARLPLGQSGQSLKVNTAGDAPEWAYLGSIENVVYVETNNGVDSPAPIYGVTLDQPFKTVRYASEQILKGHLRPNAAYLLERNRSFIQDEIVEYIDATNTDTATATSSIGNTITISDTSWLRVDKPIVFSGTTFGNIVADTVYYVESVVDATTFTVSETLGGSEFVLVNASGSMTVDFSYDKTKCRRDMGIIVDALYYDLTHNGNEKSRLAALAYFTEAGASYISNQETETAAGINYGVDVIDAVMSNVAPATVRGTLNQFVDTDYAEETDAFERVQSLASIITDAITAGNTDDVPPERIPNNSIFVKTGQFEEVLPIIIPKQTAVIGDELRSTRIVPQAPTVTSGDTVYSLAAITRLKAIINDIVADPASVVKTAGNLLDPVTTAPAGSAGDSTVMTTAGNLADEINDILGNGVANADALTFTDTGVAAKTTARTELQSNRASIITDSVSWINTNYPALVYTLSDLEDGVGYIVDALSYDVQYGGNWATTVVSRMATVDTFLLPADATSEKALLVDELKTITASYTSGATEEAEIATLLDELINVINNGADSIATITYPDYTWATTAEQNAADAILERKTEIQTHTVSHVEVNDNNLDFNSVTCYRDAGYIVDAIAYDVALGSNVQSVFAGIRYYAGTTSSELVIAEQLDATIDAINFIKQKIVFIAGAGAGVRAEQLLQDLYDYIDKAVNDTGATPYKHGTEERETSTGYTYAVESLEANRDFLIAEVEAYLADAYPAFVYEANRYNKNTNAFIDAIKYNLIWPGNHRLILEGRYYSNAINGNALEDMFYVRNGTGLRNCTVADLNGTLTAANAYGTQRPTAGAYVSLDPGYGADHADAWITNKSPYVQNVTTFGNGCIGLKIDGDLHAGGNDSVVANDFTQVLSDGIGVWCTNLARTELVSVFSYYGHIGYLAEKGGKIRATNGNSSYGTFGCSAEGVDPTEVPITGTVDNRTFDAIIHSVFTDGDEILAFEYLHAGQEYTTSATVIKTVTIASGSADPLRTEGFYTGIVGTSDGAGTGQEFSIDINSSGIATVVSVDKGGDGHAQADIITIDAADIGGTGSGLSLEVASIGNATEISVQGEGFNAELGLPQVVDGGVTEVRLLDTDVDGDSVADTGGADYLTNSNSAQEGNATTITLSNTEVVLSSQYTGMAIFIVAGVGAGQYGKIDSYNSGTKIANIVKVSDGTAGWDHIVPGTAIQTELDATTTYSVEPLVEFSAPPSGLYTDTAKGRAYVEDEKIVRITLFDPGNGYLTPPTMTITDPNNTIEAPHIVRIADGVLTQPTWNNRGQAYTTASATVNGDGFADRYQPGEFVRIAGLTDVPNSGSNVTFSGLPGQFFKLVVVRDLVGTGINGDQAPFTAQFQISPELSISDAPEQGEEVELRIRYSQVRLTGHDFLDIGTGNFTNTNYPGLPLTDPIPDNETVEQGGGRVFYTSTDQDGNFRVGELFSVEQSTGIATLNADAFNISGLQELSLGELGLGGTGATITEFSTDGTFTADSDNIVPTQKAIKTYITSQIGGGAATLNVNSITAGQIQITGQQITTTTGRQINVLETTNFQAGVDGHPIAMNYFLLG